MGSDLKTRQGRGSGSGHTKGTYTCQQKCRLYADFISCPFGAKLESVTNYPTSCYKAGTFDSKYWKAESSQ